MTSFTCLRDVLGDDVKWSKTCLQQQANLIGHCPRRPENYPEHETLKWKDYCWNRFNPELRPYVRSVGATSGVSGIGSGRMKGKVDNVNNDSFHHMKVKDDD
eukprot:3825617-Amphidinium_carterae.2